jgi:transcriptional regulator with XRE-family HTH domain
MYRYSDMRRRPPASGLDNIRLRVVAKVRELRTERRWTQAELAGKLGLSQARLSEIERGGGSFTAEQFLEVLRLFNVNVDAFTLPQRVDDELQNALARLGAFHLREVSSALPSARVGAVRVAVRETLLAPTDARLLLALAPVLLANLDALNLDVLHDEFVALGFPARVPWLVENVHAALFLARVAQGRPAAGRWHRSVAVLGDFVSRHPAPTGEAPPRLDHVDAGIRSERALAQVQAAASDISRKWGVVSDLQPADFADALRAADVAG